MEIVITIVFVVIACFFIAFLEENHKMKKLTGKSLLWWWLHSGKKDE